MNKIAIEPSSGVLWTCCATHRLREARRQRWRLIARGDCNGRSRSSVDACVSVKLEMGVASGERAAAAIAEWMSLATKLRHIDRISWVASMSAPCPSTSSPASVPHWRSISVTYNDPQLDTAPLYQVISHWEAVWVCKLCVSFMSPHASVLATDQSQRTRWPQNWAQFIFPEIGAIFCTP